MSALFIIVAGFLVFCLLVAWLAKLDAEHLHVQHRKVHEKYGHLFPITDEEFVAACSPGVNPEIALRVRDTIVDTLGVPAEIIHPDMTLLELDSL